MTARVVRIVLLTIGLLAVGTVIVWPVGDPYCVPEGRDLTICYETVPPWLPMAGLAIVIAVATQWWVSDRLRKRRGPTTG